MEFPTPGDKRDERVNAILTFIKGSLNQEHYTGNGCYEFYLSPAFIDIDELELAIHAIKIHWSVDLSPDQTHDIDGQPVKAYYAKVRPACQEVHDA